jgi:pimeloyl-ACP methyl ester carboxylesterase
VEQPQATRDATTPGGAGTDAHPAAFFNVAFRGNAQEPMPDVHDPASTGTSPAWWRDEAQGKALAAHDISPFYADVSFPKLASGATDDSGVPATGPLDRILPSHFQTAQGVDYSVSCFPASEQGGSNCPGEYQGNLQPYAIYVPPGTPPAGGWGMTLLLHSLAANYNQYLGSRNQSQYGSRGTGSIVITPEGRGPDGFYDGYAGADTFEAWADAASHYPLNPDWSDIAGYSMGGYGTFKLAEQFPDLFAKGQSTVGASADNNLVPSLRNIPIQMWNMATDELVPEASYLPTAQALDSAGYRYELDIFAPGDHLTLSINDQFAPAAAFLGTATVDRDPPHVTYVVDPALDYPQLGFVADHAYWLSGLTIRSSTPPLTGGHPEGKIDVFSHGFGTGDPAPSATGYGSGTLTGGTIPALAYTSRYKTWGPAPSAPTADRLDINATNIATMTVDPSRARVDCNAGLNVHTDGPLTVTLAGCDRTEHYTG